MEYKRLTLFAGHYGSGKTNIALNYALWLRRQGLKVTVADLDIVNPYFRTKDGAAQLEAAGVRLISSDYANSNVDLPALPGEAYSLVDDKSACGVIDVGGDDRGALALGRYVPGIREENDYEMLFVLNKARPLTRTLDDALEVFYEIEAACGLPFTATLPNGWTVRFSACPMYDRNRQQTEFGIDPDYFVSLSDDDYVKGKDSLIEFARLLLVE